MNLRNVTYGKPGPELTHAAVLKVAVEKLLDDTGDYARIMIDDDDMPYVVISSAVELKGDDTLTKVKEYVNDKLRLKVAEAPDNEELFNAYARLHYILGGGK